jgi:5-dehydro-2-deoxygluconokinase
VLQAAKSAKELRNVVVLNLDWRPTLWKAGVSERVARYKKAMAVSDVLVGNEREFMAATGKADLGSALLAVPGGSGKTLVITRGESGSEVRRSGRTYTVQGFKVPLIKGLGGGDGFIAGFIFGYLSGWGPKASATFGNAVGAIVVTGHACSESMPRLPKIISFFKKNGYSFDAESGPSKR